MLGDEERSRQLDASQGAIVTADWKWVGLPSPTPPAGTSEVIEGPGWVLSISDPSLGTEIVRSSRPPD